MKKREQPTRLSVSQGASPCCHCELPVFGRLAYPGRAAVTKHERLGRKSPSCPAAVRAAVGTIRGASKLGGRNIMKYLQPRNMACEKSLFAG